MGRIRRALNNMALRSSYERCRPSELNFWRCGCCRVRYLRGCDLAGVRLKATDCGFTPGSFRSRAGPGVRPEAKHCGFTPGSFPNFVGRNRSASHRGRARKKSKQIVKHQRKGADAKRSRLCVPPFRASSGWAGVCEFMVLRASPPSRKNETPA
jgi:hypothetical protein